MAPWDRQDDEPNLWYERFERFRLAGVGRSLLATHNAEREKAGKSATRQVPGAWNDAAETWRWRSRAEAWDEAEREAERQRLAAEKEAEREQARRDRLLLLKLLRSRAAQGLGALDPTKMKPGDLTRMVAVVVQELRTEYEEAPITRTRDEPVPPIPWEQVPEAMQVAYLNGQLSLAQVLAYVAEHQS